MYCVRLVYRISTISCGFWPFKVLFWKLKRKSYRQNGPKSGSSSEAFNEGRDGNRQITEAGETVGEKPRTNKKFLPIKKNFSSKSSSTMLHSDRYKYCDDSRKSVNFVGLLNKFEIKNALKFFRWGPSFAESSAWTSFESITLQRMSQKRANQKGFQF